MSADRVLSPPNPGKVLRQRIERDLDIAQDKLADALGVSRFTVNQVLNGRRAITPEMALRLERVIGTSPMMWLELQAAFELYATRDKLGEKLEALTPLLETADAPPLR
jgi:addiction module HigA family antidote